MVRKTLLAVAVIPIIFGSCYLYETYRPKYVLIDRTTVETRLTKDYLEYHQEIFKKEWIKKDGR